MNPITIIKRGFSKMRLPRGVPGAWRTKMGHTYMIICVFDFIVFPILWSAIQVYKGGEVTNAWTPITLQGGALFHISMGTIMGVSAHAKMREKIYEHDQHEIDPEPEHEPKARKYYPHAFKR